MKRRDVLAGALALTAFPALAQTPVPPVRVAIETAEGRIVLELYPDKAPISAANFLRYVDAGRYDGASFYRASKAPTAPQIGLVQGGVQNDPAKLFPPIAHESTAMTGLKHGDGSVSLARWAPGTATADFFICLGPSSYLDADPAAPDKTPGFAVFAQVVEGMDVVRRIHGLPTSPTAGTGAMHGEMLDPPVRILTARRAPQAQVPPQGTTDIQR
jgi:peptidyl-prolyl cis-trans isomerase A (cyclophilin A)